MDRLRRARGPIRGQLTKLMGDVEAELLKEDKDTNLLRAKRVLLQKTFTSLQEADEKVVNQMLDDAVSEQEMEAQYETALEYSEKYEQCSAKLEGILDPPAPVTAPAPPGSCSSDNGKRLHHLPKIKIKSFNGEIVEFLGFWAQFSQIHDDDRIDDAVKFIYFLEKMEAGTPAERFAEKYRNINSADNYPKMINAFHDRFGKKDLLVEVYIRQLLKLITKNVNLTQEQFEIGQLYDQLESHLGNLESLSVHRATHSPLLFPMVESCLPVPVIRAWQRSSHFLKEEDTKLENLMKFLATEVEGEQRITLARGGFGAKTETTSPTTTKKERTQKERKEATPTAMGLVNADTGFCTFCDKKHPTHACRTAQKWTMEERQRKLRSAGACFVCLTGGHISKKCLKNDVKCSDCGGKHFQIMCFKKKVIEPPARPPEFPPVSQQECWGRGPAPTHSMANTTCTPDVYMQTLLVTAVNGVNRIVARATLDSASQRSYVSKELIRKLGYSRMGTTRFSHALFGGQSSGVVEHNRYKLFLESLDNSFGCNFDVFDQAVICCDVPKVTDPGLLAALQRANVPLTDSGEGSRNIDILIGADVMRQLLTGKLVQVTKGVRAIQTLLGWTVMGKSPASRREHAPAATALSMINWDLTDLWELEKIGIEDPIEKLTKHEQDLETKRFFLETVSKGKDGRFTVKLPFVPGHPAIPSNRGVAEARLESATKRLKTQGGLKEYFEVFEEWKKAEIIEEVFEREPGLSCHYLPHRPVFKPESTTTKIRPVFDASCQGFNGKTKISLNQCMRKGPNMLELIPDLLLRFRENPVAATADIRKAFLMINIDEKDRDWLRFLWWRDVECIEIVEFRHRRVVFGMNCSPFLLGAVIDFHLAGVMTADRPVAEKIRKSLYVDNVLASFPSEEEYKKFKKKAIDIMAEAKMDLRLWESNVEEAEDDGASSVLGISWDRESDNLFCEVDLPKVEEKKVTRRTILSMVSRIFDPIGIVAPVTLIPKLILQKTWHKKLGWDDPVDTDTEEKFRKWLKEVEHVPSVRIPRYAKLDQGSVSFHIFCDASKSAYAAVAFARTEKNGEVELHMLMTKSRVAPLKPATINRLELIACEIGSRVATTIRDALATEDLPTTLWTDSRTALAWIMRDEDWGTFVGNRVRKILDVTRADQWKHVPGYMNPADVPSRGCNVNYLLETQFWKGPEWLREPPSEWPSFPAEENDDEILAEKKKSTRTMANQCEDLWYSPEVCKLNKFSSLVKVIGFVWRFIQKSRKRSVHKSTHLSHEEQREAEKKLFNMIQKEAFQPDQKFPFVVDKDEDGLICVVTRMLPNSGDYFRRPVLLPSNHYLVDLLIKEEHEQNCHAGVQYLMSHLRERVWILKGRKTVEKVVKNCITCRRFTTKNPVPVPGPIPEDRLQATRAFQNVGVDLAGPLYLKDKKKVWICLFTCAVYRGVHLELVTSLSTEAFLLSMRRFIARFGRPSVIFCDNGTNFVGAKTALANLNWKKIESETECRQMTWKFSPPLSPWWGGFFERMIKTVKELLVRMLGKSVLTFEELQTVLLDVEAVVNARPLTYVYENDVMEPLTPAHFIHGLMTKETADLDKIDRDDFCKRYRYRQHLMEELRGRFQKEYLSTLVQRRGKRNEVTVKVGDIVIIQKENKKRVMWPIGLVEQIKPGRDGIGRVALVKTQGGILIRAIQRLFPLELSRAEAERIVEETEEPDGPSGAGESAEKTRPTHYQTRYGRNVKPTARY